MSHAFTRAAAASALTIALLGLTACSKAEGSASKAAKSGKVAERNYAATDFTGVELKGSDNVRVVEGATFAVVAKGPVEDLDDLKIEVAGDTLEVGRKSNGSWSWSSDDAVEVTVTMPTLTHASIAGSGDMTVARAKGAKVSASIAGSGNLSIAAVEADALELEVAGSGDLAVKGGAAKSGDFSMAGSGDIDATGVKLADADIDIAGSGDISATVSGAANVSSVGSGDVTVTGGAKCDTSSMGSGDVKCS